MGDKDHKHDMDAEKLAKWTKKIAELGVPEDQIDEHLIWSFKKAVMKLSKLRLVLDDKGVAEADAKAIIDKVAAHANQKDLAKIHEWKAKHHDHHDHHHDDK